MNCIALWQPWATLMAIGAKTCETRSWHTHTRGHILIYATKKQDLNLRKIFYSEPFYSTLFKAGYRQWDELPFGALLSIHNLKRVIRTSQMKGITDLERAFGDYSPGRFAFEMELIKRFPEPIPFEYPIKGPSKFFEVPEVVIERE